MARIEYRTLPVRAFLEHTVLVPAGTVTFGIEYRRLDEAAILAEYGPESRAKFDDRRPAGMPAVVEEDGLALHVFDSGSGDELLRFDCLRDTPHWHLLTPKRSRNLVIEHEPAHGPLLELALRELRTRLRELLCEAGATELAGRLDDEQIAAALTTVAQVSRYVEAAGRPVRVEREAPPHKC